MKKKIRLLWQLYPSYLILIIISLVTVSFYISSYMETFFLHGIKKDLQVRGELFKSHIKPLIMAEDFSAIDVQCEKFGKSSETRFTVISPDGRVMGDSEKNADLMENHKNRPEVLSALKGEIGSSIRDSETLRTRMMYVTLPIYGERRIIAVLRAALPVTSIHETINALRGRVIMVGFVVALLASFLVFVISKMITRPIEEMKKGAARFAEGDLDHRLHEPQIYELSALSGAMNQMAATLNERIAAVRNQRNEYQAVLSSMSEGVIGIDLEEKILNINQAAMAILKIERMDIKGRSIQEVVRDPDFHRFIQHAVSSPEPEEDDFTIYHLGNRIINTLSAPLRNASDQRIGTLIVLNDVTQVRNLDTIRKDFVANVSHEIKTPLTAIKGFVETLTGNDDETPENKRRFLQIIMKHVDRLNSILEDLLVLARLEQKNGSLAIVFERKRVKEVIETALQVVQPKAGKKEITIELEVVADLTANLDIHLIEQALVNLIDNAIKYSPEKTTVRVSSGLDETGGLVIRIRDHGQGIPEEHLSRIFERFYRVDKARSRALGGTGLGLSIVKHIASVHGGHVSVTSELERGSTFSIHLPKTLLAPGDL